MFGWVRAIRDLLGLVEQLKKFQADSESRALANQMRGELWEFQRSMLVAMENSLLLGHVEQSRQLPSEHKWSPQSLLVAREMHFAEEKEFICRQFVEHVARRVSPENHLILLLDAGSTVLPIFRLLCEHPTFDDLEMCECLTIVTNNLGGVTELMHHGTVGSAAAARTKFECHLPQGSVDSTYEAVLGDKTEAGLKEIVTELRSNKKTRKGKSGKSEGPLVIAAVTGNYVSIQDGILARGEKHTKVKEAMITVADESYLLAPLGKLIPCTCEEFNSLIAAHDQHGGKSYVSVKYSPQKRPTLTYTYRGEKYGSGDAEGQNLKRYLVDVADAIEESPNGVYSLDPKWKWQKDPFDLSMSMRVNRQLMDEEDAIWKYEFPHPPIQELMKRLVNSRQSGVSVKRLASVFLDPKAEVSASER